jgi:tripartite-type tricarboxylate transporter receptor subunit TctC
MKTFRLLAPLAMLAAASVAIAQTYPAKPVTFIVPFSPGGGTDISARTVANKLTARWGKSVIVDNRAGAGGFWGRMRWRRRGRMGTRC